MNRHGLMMRKGFTLVELLVSITLTIFILTLFATLFGAGNDAVRAARGSGEIDRSVQGSITKIKRDLEHVYIGEGVRLSEAFTSASNIPSAGYFTIEENLPASLPYYCQSEAIANSVTSPAHDPNFQARVVAINNRLSVNPAGKPAVGYRQGIDDRGLPVEVDVDDVLAFTVRLSGDSPSDIFYGRVPVGSVLDNDLDPGSRFDSPDNGQFTSPMAEVCYFLRADRPYELAEINRPALGTDDGRLARAATYTLYRRELLVLSESQRTRVEERLLGLTSPPAGGVIGDMARPTVIASNASLQPANTTLYNPSAYQNYDVAVRFDAALGLLRFNDIGSLRWRQNRYGMQWQNTLPFPNAIVGVFNPQHAAPFYDLVALGAGMDVSMHIPNPPPGTYAAGVRPIFRGRPTLFESTIVGSEGVADANYSPVANPRANWSFGNAALGFDSPVVAPRPISARRGNADVLLTNVLAFDVKVLNDDLPLGRTGSLLIPSDQKGLDLGVGNIPVEPKDSKEWPAARTASLIGIDPDHASFQIIPPSRLLSMGSPVGNASRRTTNSGPFAMGIATPSDVVIQPDFIDLGQTLAAEVPFGIGLPRTLPTNLPTQSLARPFLSQSECKRLDDTLEPDPSKTPRPFPTKEVPWGRHTPARWLSSGRREAWVNSAVTGSTVFPLANVYDTWAKEYNAELFSTDYNPVTTALNQVAPTKYLPPYDRPLRGIQITIRTLEPRSGLVREFQVVHRF